MFVTFENVTKFYGPVIGLNDVSCRIGPGITGMFGANGAGKSTMMKLASGQLRPSLGRVLIGVYDAWTSAAKRQMGYSPDLTNFYEEMSGREFVETMARLHGFPGAEARQRTEIALREVNMQDRASRRIGGDEPMTGIDPGGRREMGELFRSFAAQGRTVLISTHLLAEVEDLADTILVIARGRAIASGTLSEIRALLADQPLTLGIDVDRPRELAALLVQTPHVRAIEVHGHSITLRTLSPAQFHAQFGDLVTRHGFEVHRLETLDAGADAVFSYLQQENGST
ncbi:MAG: ABC transporter ATP-binding protein [Planctomycetia bacterium]|nr:ABC transporter ATP-binding protein [Planctomycetia bacterium]